MDMVEIIELREKLERDIHASLDNFQRSTGVLPIQIKLYDTTVQRIGLPDERLITHVLVRCELP